MDKKTVGMVLLGVLAFGCAGSGGDDTYDSRPIVVPDATPRMDGRPPDAPVAMVCDPVNQTVCAGATPKCSLVDDGTMMDTLEPGCVAATGAGAQMTGQTCTRTAEGAPGWGHDDCAPGGWCSGVGVIPPSQGGSRICRPFCANDATCATGERCLGLLEDPQAGYCIRACTLFVEDCGTGLTCGSLALDIDLTYVFAYCRPVGTVVPDATCGIDLECQAGYACLDLTMDGMANPKCVQLCDTVHPCTTGTCNDQPDLADAGGFCM